MQVRMKTRRTGEWSIIMLFIPVEGVYLVGTPSRGVSLPILVA